MAEVETISSETSWAATGRDASREAGKDTICFRDFFHQCYAFCFDRICPGVAW